MGSKLVGARTRAMGQRHDKPVIQRSRLRVGRRSGAQPHPRELNTAAGHLSEGPYVTLERDAPVPGRRTWRKAARDLLGRRADPRRRSSRPRHRPLTTGRRTHSGTCCARATGRASSSPRNSKRSPRGAPSPASTSRTSSTTSPCPASTARAGAAVGALGDRGTPGGHARRAASRRPVRQRRHALAAVALVHGRRPRADRRSMSASTRPPPQAGSRSRPWRASAASSASGSPGGTRHGMAAARARGQRQGPIAVADVPELHARIARMREEGMTLQAIADVLNEEGVPTLRGGAKWRPSSVQRAAGYRRPASYGGLSRPPLRRVNATNFGPCTHGVRSGNAGRPCQRTDLAPTMRARATPGEAADPGRRRDGTRSGGSGCGVCHGLDGFGLRRRWSPRSRFRSRRAAPPARGAPGQTVDLKVLLISADGSEPGFGAWKAELEREGVPYDTLVAYNGPDQGRDADRRTPRRLRRPATRATRP